jgi:trans-aconitate methyltransferase
MHSETSDDRMQPAYDLLELFYTDNMHVLEVGVSDGNYAKLLRRTVPFRSYEGVELSPAIKEASSKVDAVHNMTIQQLASGKKLRMT